MIQLDVPARMVCIEDGCGKSEPVKLFLNTMGCIQFKPEVDGWQIARDTSAPVSPYLSRCPEHVKKVQQVQAQIGPAGPRLVLKGA